MDNLASMSPHTRITPRKLHIAIFSSESSVHTKRWVDGLRGLGHKVELVTLQKDPDHDIGGISLDAKSKFGYIGKIQKLKVIVKKLNPDIFHVHHASSYGFLGSFVPHKRKVLSVWGSDITDFPYHNFINRTIVKRTLQAYDRITATSEFLKQKVSCLYKGPISPAVIPFGIDLDIFKPIKSNSHSSSRIGFAKGCLAPMYGIDILLKAFRSILDRGAIAELCLLGGGKHLELYKQMVRDQNMEDKVLFVDFINHNDMPAFLATLDIFAMPSICEEGFGVVALEASAMSVPVVATRVGGIPEVIVDGTTGILVQKQNATELAAAFMKLINDPALRIKMGDQGRKFVERKYNWDDNLRAMQNLYWEMMS
jgi:L-malate glycosyltransferase